LYLVGSRCPVSKKQREHALSFFLRHPQVEQCGYGCFMIFSYRGVSFLVVLLRYSQVKVPGTRSPPDLAKVTTSLTAHEVRTM
jgi:hypothetical protein